MRPLAFRLYLIFVLSWFLHIPSRIPALGAIRMDLLLFMFISALIFFSEPEEGGQIENNSTNKTIKVMFAYILLSLPLVQWPGSVIGKGLPSYIKVVSFYFFTISLITTEKRLKTFMFVFLLAQSIRVIEPVILHITTGYWGSHANMDNYQSMDRLSGAPSDTVNPNGLAFVILMVFPFLHYLTDVNWKNKIVYLIMAPTLLYAIILTASRTGFVCLLVVLAGFWWKSRHKMVLTVMLVIGGVVAIGLMSGNLKDRYLSIVSDETANAGTASGRMTQLEENLEVAMRKPIVGHGLGTSVEANANYGTFGKIAHNLIAEILQELGFVGLIIFIFFVRSILKNFSASLKVLKENRERGSQFLRSLTDAMQVWIFMNLIFSIASYGFSSYEWYLFGGLSIVLSRLAARAGEQAAVEEPRTDAENPPYPGAVPA